MFTSKLFMRQSLFNKLECGRARAGSSRQPDSCKRHVGMSDVPPHTVAQLFITGMF